MLHVLVFGRDSSIVVVETGCTTFYFGGWAFLSGGIAFCHGQYGQNYHCTSLSGKRQRARDRAGRTDSGIRAARSFYGSRSYFHALLGG